jgi:diacylglycerol kinase family enzyme
VRNHHVERSFECLGDNAGDGDPTARNPEDEERRISQNEPRRNDGRREALASFCPVAIPHATRLLRRAVPSVLVPKLLLVANPSASGLTGGLFREVMAILNGHYDVEPTWPLNPGETRREVAAAAESGYDTVVAMGGDGVVHHVANSLVGSDTALGIIPAGTTNVLARILDVPSKPRKAAQALATWSSIPTAMLEVTADGVATEYATFALGIGFDADVVEIAEQRPYSKARFGGIHYARTAVGRLLAAWRNRHADLRVDCDGERLDALAVLAQVHGPYTYFGKVPLHITGGDGGLAAMAAEDLAIHRSTELFTRAVLRRRIPERLGVRVWVDFERLTIEADPPARYQADGEFLGIAHHLDVTPVQDAIRVLRAPDNAQS